MARPIAHKWSQDVTEHSDALDLKDGVFKEKDPKKIARSLKDSAEHSERRKSDPYRSAMSMLTFYINRAGAQLQPGDKLRLEKAKDDCAACSTGPRRAARQRWGAGWRSPARAGKAARAGRPMGRSMMGSMRISDLLGYNDCSASINCSRRSM